MFYSNASGQGMQAGEVNNILMFYLLVLGVVLFELKTRGRLCLRCWREVARAFMLMELGVLELLRKIFKPKFVVTGQCQRRGTCCTMIVGDPPRFVKQRQYLLGLFVGYHRVLHKFKAVNRGDNGEVIFSCGYLQTDGRCGIYRHRPFICRNYPIKIGRAHV